MGISNLIEKGQDSSMEKYLKLKKKYILDVYLEA